jgi:amino acid adenylation domain-containing protein
MSEMDESTNAVSDRRALLLERIKERRRASAGQERTIPKRKTTGDCPLSYGQELMWLLDQLSPEGSTAYNSIWTGRLSGPLNLGALLQAVNTIMERHQILRTVYAAVDSVPVQRVADYQPHDLPLIDLSGIPVPQRELEAQRLLEEEARRPFDLSRDLMMRGTLVRMAEHEYLLNLVMHHIAIDGWAKDIIYRELSELYDAFSSNRPPALPELPIQYADFAVWQRNWITGQLLDKQLGYWLQRLAGAPPLLELPTDYPRPSVQEFRGSHERTVFSTTLLRDLKTLSQREGATLFMTLMAAFQVLLYRYSGREDMLVATVVANRPRPELEKLIGYFSNSLLLRTDLSGDPSFRDLMHQVRDVALEAYDHQDLPFEKLLVELKPDRDLSYSPLFQVMFNLQNHEREQVKLSRLGISELKTERGSSKFDLTLNIVEKSDGLRVAFEYNTDLFKADTIRRMLGHFQTLLEGAVCNPAERISLLPLLTAPERRQVLTGWNDTRVHYPTDRCIHQLFEAQVEQTPDAIAVVWENHHLTYAELNARANQLAYYLKRHGVGPEVLVVACLERSLDMVVGVLGVLKAGGAYIPLDAEFAKERLLVVLQDARPVVLLTQQHIHSADVSDANIQVVYLDSERRNIARESTATPATQAAPQNLAYVIYTSGSTGHPKGVTVTHASLVNACMAWQDAYQLRSVARSHLQMANFSFDVFTGDLVRALCSGGKLVLCPLEVLLDPARLYELMVEQAIDCAEFVPSVLRNLLHHLQQSGQRLDFMRVLIAGSDIWHPEEHLGIEGLCGRRTRVINGYGVAEATIDSCYYERKSTHELPVGGIVPIGRPFSNTQLYILDRNLQPVPIGVPGELFIAGPGVARGYLNDPGLTSQKFLAEPFSSEPESRMYRSGDLARYLPDGNIEFLGRRDHQVKIRGFRVELGEIEVVLRDHPEVQEAVVVAHTLALGEKQLVAYVVSKQERVATQQELRRFLKEKLPAYMVPSSIVVIEALPLTPNGKIDRKALPKPEPAPREGGDGFIAPRSPQEQMLAQIWAEVLKVDQVGMEDNFFELGGHSLSAIQVVSRIREKLKLELSVRSLFENPTIAEMAEFIKAAQNNGAPSLEPPIAPVSRDSVRAKRSSFVV